MLHEQTMSRRGQPHSEGRSETSAAQFPAHVLAAVLPVLPASARVTTGTDIDEMLLACGRGGSEGVVGGDNVTCTPLLIGLRRENEDSESAFVCHTYSKAGSWATQNVSHVTRQTSQVTRHTSHVTRHTSHVTRHTSHVTRHTSHVTRHTSHVTRHTSHVT